MCCRPWGHKETDTAEQLTYTYELTYRYERTHLDFINYTSQPQLNSCHLGTHRLAPPQIHPCQVRKQTTPPPSMPGQHIDHPTSIHARSPHRPPHLHPRQVTTQTIPAPSMPGRCTDHPSSIHARSAHRPSIITESVYCRGSTCLFPWWATCCLQHHLGHC